MDHRKPAPGRSHAPDGRIRGDHSRSFSSAHHHRSFESRLSDPISEAQYTISAVSADARIVDVLHCAAGSPILRIDRLFINTHGDPIVLSVGYFLPDQYTYRTQLRRSALS